MTVMLDTNIVIRLTQNDAAVTRALGAIAEPIAISAVTRVELEGGVYAHPEDTLLRRALVDTVLASIETIAFDDDDAVAYGAIVAVAGYSRRKLLDRMIAAQALIRSVALATANPSDFSDIPGLSLLAW
ncbi:MAG: PIN domain-containing protein [Bauldia sp.]|nr:PIN domain-containing protein [Bauldia sp.]